jgi:uncharacterized protein with HEPN domain
MVHHYEGINREEVWRAAEADIPALLATLELSAPPGET